MIPEKLYGREREVESLLAAFDRVVESGAPELVLVSGYSGIGKSSVVNELHKALVPPRGLFACGKFDQLKRDIPYSRRSGRAIRRSCSARATPSWRLAARMTANRWPAHDRHYPELKSSSAISRRFRRSSRSRRKDVSSWCSAASSASLPVRNIRWRCSSTIFNGWTRRRSTLLEDLLTQTDVQHLLLIGAYRDNEVDAAHPLMRKLTAIRSSGAKVSGDRAWAPRSWTHRTADCRCASLQA